MLLIQKTWLIDGQVLLQNIYNSDIPPMEQLFANPDSNIFLQIIFFYFPKYTC